MQGRPHSAEPMAEKQSHCLDAFPVPILASISAEERDCLDAIAAKNKEGHEKPQVFLVLGCKQKSLDLPSEDLGSVESYDSCLYQTSGMLRLDTLRKLD